MASYRIEVSSTAEKQLKKIPAHEQKRVLDAILGLAAEPFPLGTRKLSGHDDVFRIRVGNYRIIYSVESQRVVIVVLKVGHRKDMYR